MKLILGDCLDILPSIDSGSIDCIICDLPYGTTYANWDSIIDLGRLWEQYKRVIRGNGAIVLTSNQPFTTKLIQSNFEWFRYEWIWNKENASNFANAKKQPLKQHENVLIFSKSQPPYYPVKYMGKKNHRQGKSTSNTSETRLISKRVEDDLSGMKYPKSILNFPKHSSQCGFHPTQKPIELIEYLINTYTKEGEVVLDNAMGSGTTGAACARLNRKFIGIERDEKYYKIALDRIMREEEEFKL